MRGLYGLIFVGFTVVGFASVFNAHEAGIRRSRNVSAAQPVPVTAVASSGSAITVQTDLVEPLIVRGDAPVVPVSRRVPQHNRTMTRSSRSMFARLVLGDGQFRPHPFPTPASGLK